jgi:hypothetical protein
VQGELARHVDNAEGVPLLLIARLGAAKGRVDPHPPLLLVSLPLEQGGVDHIVADVDASLEQRCLDHGQDFDFVLDNVILGGLLWQRQGRDVLPNLNLARHHALKELPGRHVLMVHGAKPVG